MIMMMLMMMMMMTVWCLGYVEDGNFFGTGLACLLLAIYHFRYYFILLNNLGAIVVLHYPPPTDPIEVRAGNLKY